LAFAEVEERGREGERERVQWDILRSCLHAKHISSKHKLLSIANKCKPIISRTQDPQRERERERCGRRRTDVERKGSRKQLQSQNPSLSQ